MTKHSPAVTLAMAAALLVGAVVVAAALSSMAKLDHDTTLILMVCLGVGGLSLVGVREHWIASAFQVATLESLGPTSLNGVAHLRLTLGAAKAVTLSRPGSTLTVTAQERCHSVNFLGEKRNSKVVHVFEATRPLTLPATLAEGEVFTTDLEVALPLEVHPTMHGKANHLETLAVVRVSIGRLSLELETEVLVRPEYGNG